MLCESGHAKISDLGLGEHTFSNNLEFINYLKLAIFETNYLKQLLGHMDTWRQRFWDEVFLTHLQPIGFHWVVCFISFYEGIGETFWITPFGNLTYLSPFRAHKTKDKREIDRRTIEYNPEMPDEFSDDLKDLVNGLLQKKPSERLGHNGAQELMVSIVKPAREKPSGNFRHEDSLKAST